MVTLHEVKKLQEETDPRIIREKNEAEQSSREATEQPPQPEATPEQRAALRKQPQQRTPQDRAILAEIGIQ